MDIKKASGIIIILHTVGAIGTFYEDTREIFLFLTPFNLLISALFLLIYDQNNRKDIILFFILSSIFGYLLELIGVKTGFPFGSYEYHETLGIKLFDVPLVIGINWFILSYCFSNLVANYIKTIIVSALVGSLLMTFFDVIIEPVAIKLDYWQWKNNTIPIANYLSWFVAGAIIQYFYHQKVHKINNPLTFSVLIGQLIYFLSVLLLW